jgi:uncharacterized membrane protein YgaE (UPF0421/DUF939 family)
VAWIIASRVIKHHQPFFAPIAAVVGLNTTLGRRGINALKLLLGVFIGIAVGETTILTLGGGVGRLPIALLVAMCVAAAFGGTNVTRAQAAVGVILTVTLSHGEAGINRAEPPSPSHLANCCFLPTHSAWCGEPKPHRCGS